MFRGLNGRTGHAVLLVAVAAALFLPNLGAPSLWDIDEGNNAHCAWEMLERGDYIVPYFNYELRCDKPVLLYWCQIAAYRLFGVGEFAARLPSALAGLATVLLTWQLGRLLFGGPAGLIVGLVLASTVMFCASAHFANPDCLLNAFTVLTFLIFWRSFARGGRGWFVPAGVSTGLAVLAKGPVGLVLPLAVTGAFLLWSRRLRLLMDRRLLLGAAVFALVALPWYAWVGAETKGEFLRGFFFKHNVDRFLAPLEGHRGPVYYHALSLIVGFTPWSVFLGLAGWYAVRQLRARAEPTAGDRAPAAASAAGCVVDPRSAVRFLVCWVGVYFIFFSLAGTKLPNYILPLYPPVALLMAQFLDRWRRGEIRPAAWAVNTSLACLALIGVTVSLGLLVAGGAIVVPALHGRQLAGLEGWAVVGAVPVLAAVAARWCVRRQYRGGLVACVATAALLLIGPLVAWGSLAVDAYKAPRPLVQVLRAAQAEREIRVGCYEYFQPSLVFYCHRQVLRLEKEPQVLEFLRYPVPVYLFLPASAWAGLEARVEGPHRLLGRHYDLYRGCEVVLVTNAAGS